MSAALLFLPFLTIPVTAMLGVYLVQLYNTKTNRPDYRFYELVFPSEVRVDQVIDWWTSVSATFAKSSSLTSQAETVVIEVRSDGNGITHRLGVPWQHVELLDQLRTHITGIHVAEHKLETVPQWTYATELGVYDRTRQLDVEKIEAQARRILTSTMSEQKTGDAVAVQIVINPVGRTGNFLMSFAKSLTRTSKPSKEVEAEQRAKAGQHQFRAVLRIVAASTTEPHAKKLVGNVYDAYRALNNKASYLRKTSTPRSKIMEAVNKAYSPVLYPAQLSTSELTALSGWPVGDALIPGLKRGRTRYLPPNDLVLREGRRLGMSYQNRPIALSPVDACRHMYVIGPSGLGKTTLLANTLQQDIERGFGVVVIESKGDLFRAALNAVPRERVNDVIVMDMTDQDWPVGLNVLQGGNVNKRVDELTRLFARGDGDVYFRDIMYHGLHTLAHFPELTIVDLIPFLMPPNAMLKAWREGLINRLPKSSEFYHYWKAFDQLKPTEQRSRIQPVLNRLWEVTNRRDLRNMFGQSESTIDLRAAMRDNKLIFVYIPDSIGSETVSLLTSLLFKELWDAVRDVEKDKPTFLYLDEMQRLRGVDLAEVLSLARSFKYGLNLAHQQRAQLTPELQAAIANAATKIAFKLEGPDANWLQSLMGKAVTADDFMSLGPYEVIAQVGVSGGSSAPTWFKTLSPIKPHGLAAEVRHSSRQRFSRRAADVDKAILRRRSAPSEPVKAKPTFGYVEKEGD